MERKKNGLEEATESFSDEAVETLASTREALDRLSQSPGDNQALKTLTTGLSAIRDGASRLGEKRLYDLTRQSGVNMVFAISEPDHPMLRAFRGLVRVDTALYLYLKALRPDVALGDGPVFIDGVDL